MVALERSFMHMPVDTVPGADLGWYGRIEIRKAPYIWVVHLAAQKKKKTEGNISFLSSDLLPCIFRDCKIFHIDL